jgi:hypothetical protein
MPLNTRNTSTGVPGSCCALRLETQRVGVVVEGGNVLKRPDGRWEIGLLLRGQPAVVEELERMLTSAWAPCATFGLAPTIPAERVKIFRGLFLDEANETATDERGEG